LSLQIDLDRIGGTNLWTTTSQLPAELPSAERSLRRDDDEAPDTRMVRLLIDRLPLGRGQLRLVASLHDAAGQFIDRTETLVDVRPSDLTQAGLLELDHRWEWDETPAASLDAGEQINALGGSSSRS
jgi:hypothetical protein